MTALATLNPIPQYVDLAGSPLDGGRLYFGVANQNPETNPITVYWDAAATQPAAQPIRTKNGYPVRSGTPAVVYAIGDYSLMVRDQRRCQVLYAPNSADFNNVAQLLINLATSIGASLIGFIQAGIGAVLRTVQSKLRESVSTADFGAVADGVTSDAVAVANANTRAASIGSQLLLQGVHNIGAPVTITAPIVDTMAQIFSTTSQVTIDNGLPVRPEWFGSAAGNIRLAVNALPAAGGVVRVESRSYPPSFNTITPAKVTGGTAVPGVDYLAKKGVKFQGSKLPNFKTPVAGVIAGLECGSIIQGPFYVAAADLEWENIGIDSGPDVCTALYAGVAQDGFAMVQPNQVAPVFVGGLRIGRVIGLCQGIAAAVHAVLIEAATDGTIQEATGAQALHGVVIKSQGIHADLLRGIGNTGEGVLCKSDSYAPMGSVIINQVEASSISAAVETGHGFLVDSVTASGASVQVGRVRAFKKANGCTIRTNGANITADVEVGELISESCFIGLLWSGDIRRVSFNSAIVNNCTYGVQVEAGVTSPACTINTLKVANGTDGINLAGRVSVGNADFDTLSGFGINYVAASARCVLGTFRSNSIPNLFNLQPALAGTWVNEGTAGNEVFRVTLDAGHVKVSGLIKSGAAATIVAALDGRLRPLENMRFLCDGDNAGAVVPVRVSVGISGVISISNFAAAPTSISLDGVSWPIPT